MPALQSIWFVPHVTAYILSYAILGAATIVGLKQLYQYDENDKLIDFTDNLVYIGFGLLMLGMLMGAVWAKAAWGHYWSWDPKETWAFVTAAAYLFYIHIRWNNHYRKTALWMLVIAFICLMITWKGVNYLPSAKNSVHVYGQQ
jgi:ABC-type transport system involved in cytochrome c biogenesis permease subunit